MGATVSLSFADLNGYATMPTAALQGRGRKMEPRLVVMKLYPALTLTLFILTALVGSGCQRQPGDMWEDTKTAGRYMGRGIRSLGGKHGDSRQVPSREAFGIANHYDDAFIPLVDEEAEIALALGEIEAIPQAQETPGDPGSTIPGIDAFRDAVDDPELARIFRNIQFAYDSELIKGRDNLEIVQSIANYLKRHPNVCLFVEGHCDERGPQAYNLALGMRRSNAVRTLLIKEGVPLDNVFTISYGKERPLELGQGESVWSKNRRAQFKVYHR